MHRPLATVRLRSAKLAFVELYSIRTALPPLIVMLWPEPSSTVSYWLETVSVSVIVPSQAKVTVPPPAMAARNAASVQFVTVWICAMPLVAAKNSVSTPARNAR